LIFKIIIWMRSADIEDKDVHDKLKKKSNSPAPDDQERTLRGGAKEPGHPTPFMKSVGGSID